MCPSLPGAPDNAVLLRALVATFLAGGCPWRIRASPTSGANPHVLWMLFLPLLTLMGGVGPCLDADYRQLVFMRAPCHVPVTALSTRLDADSLSKM